MDDTEMTVRLIVLEKGGGLSLALAGAKLQKVVEGEGDLPCRRTDRLTSDAVFPDDEVLPCAAPIPNGGGGERHLQ